MFSGRRLQGELCRENVAQLCTCNQSGQLSFLIGHAKEKVQKRSEKTSKEKRDRRTLTVAVTTSGNLLFVIVVVGRRQQVTEDQGRDVALLGFVHHNRDSFSVVPHGNFVLFRSDFHLSSEDRPVKFCGQIQSETGQMQSCTNFHAVLALIALFVVGGVHEDLIEDFVESWYKSDLAKSHALFRAIVDPQFLGLWFDRPNIRVRSQENVLCEK